KVPPLVGKVPALGGTTFLPTIAPAIPSVGTIIRKRPASMSIPSETLYQGVLAFRPAEAEPLLPAPVGDASRLYMRPRGPPLLSDDTPYGDTALQAVKPRMISGKISAYSMASFISRDSIFLPRYSGVRPTINPAMNTVSTTKTSIP